MDLFTPALGVIAEGQAVICGVCGSKCNEQRGVRGWRSFSAALAKVEKDIYDWFACPHRLSKEHLRLKNLRAEAVKTPSHALRDIYLKEAEELCAKLNGS
jgi:hypothetical protein